MRIKIVKCSNPQWWYNHRVGEEHIIASHAADGSVGIEVIEDGEKIIMPIRQDDWEVVDLEPDEYSVPQSNSKDIKLVYVAAPYRTQCPLERTLNVQAARYAGMKLAKLGFYPVMPTVNTEGFDNVGSDQFWLESTKELMRRCDAVYIVDGSHESQGVQGEIEEARECGLPVFVLIEGLIDA